MGRGYFQGQTGNNASCKFTQDCAFPYVFLSVKYQKMASVLLIIDKSFIDTVISDNNTKIITESIVYMVKKLGYETVAEGVETKEQFEYLRSICSNCSFSEQALAIW